MKVVSIILARGGSKGIPGKNIVDFCNKPLLAWTIEQALASNHISDVWVSSDSEEVLTIATKFGARCIKRPREIAGDFASSESGWLHAITHIEAEQKCLPDYIVAPQVTSPIRSSKDFDDAIDLIDIQAADSLLSVARLDDFFIWRNSSSGVFEPVNYDYTKRKRRQEIEGTYLETGSFYIFKPSCIRETNNRLSGKIARFVMPFYKSFQIDCVDDLSLCEVVMRGYGLHL